MGMIYGEQISPAEKAKRSTEQSPRDWLPREIERTDGVRLSEAQARALRVLETLENDRRLSMIAIQVLGILLKCPPLAEDSSQEPKGVDA
jgi:hypothetical protein